MEITSSSVINKVFKRFVWLYFDFCVADLVLWYVWVCGCLWVLMGFWVSGCLRVFMGFQVSIGTYGGHWCRWMDGLFMRVYGGLWVSLSAMRIYKFLWGCLWATIIFYMSDYGYMIVYGCSWVFVSVYECL